VNPSHCCHHEPTTHQLHHSLTSNITTALQFRATPFPLRQPPLEQPPFVVSRAAKGVHETLMQQTLILERVSMPRVSIW